MEYSFTEAYEILVNLKNRKEDKVCILCASHINRIKQLADFFEEHSKYSVSRIDLSKIAEFIMLEISVTGNKSVERTVSYMKRKNTEYLIIEDKVGIPKDFTQFDNMNKAISTVGKDMGIIIVCEHAGEFCMLYNGDLPMIDVFCQNEQSLKIKYVSLDTDEIIKRNQILAAKTGVLWSNKEYYENLIEKKMLGDYYLENSRYHDAFLEYNEALSFHSDFIDGECSINDFIDLALFVRCVACYLYGGFEEHSKANTILKEEIKEILDDLKESDMMEKHEKMILEYEKIAKGIIDGNLDRITFLLFLKEYVV